jgi:hypothetical protein
MNTAEPNPTVTAALLASALPTDLAGRRVLEFAPAGGDEELAAELSGRGPALLARKAPTDDWAAGGPYDFVVCRDVIQSDAHPARLMLGLWEAIVEGGTLVLAAPVMTAATRSRYARFVASAAGAGETGWLPGRLALRWSVETSAFEVERWLAAAEDATEETAEVALVAARTARYPSLILATPTRPEETPDDRR